ncbi:SpoIIIAH-like family protein [Bacillus testis]|uniref:SpoIIIAH-like family protein n=1 Tax=Bacillus testis TaxID=1622072 RepID=UPI00067E9C54|nr:SpoIIIAH-like family protein [Bacillus testis]
MLLKKQTVWLLTMLSLVIVLSVYYVTTPPKKGNEMATTVQKEKDVVKEGQTNTVAKNDTKEKSVSKQVVPAGDEKFETVRMDIQDQRSKQIEELNAKLSNTELSAEERNEAKNAIDTLNTRSEKEEMLQGMIEGMNGTKAALVRTDNDNNVQVSIKTAKHDKTTANEIFRLVAGEMPTANDITVDVQPNE